MDEVVDVVDEKGNVLGQVLKREAHEKGLLHKTIIGYLRRGYDWVLVRQSSSRQDAGLLVAPVGGHVRAGETNEEALIREAGEEIGTRNISYKYIGQSIFRRQVLGRDENHVFVAYEITTDDGIILNHESVSLHSFTSDKLRAALEGSPEEFGDGYYFILEHFYPDYLPAEYNFKWRRND